MHTGNTGPSCTCEIQKYRFYTMLLSQYHGYCQYHESMSIPRGFFNTMRLCQYHESMSIPRVHVHTTSPCLYYESMPIYTMRPKDWITEIPKKNYGYINYRNIDIQSTYLPKYKLHKYRNTNYRNTEMQIEDIPKYKLQKYRNKLTDIRIYKLQKYRRKK